MTQPTVHPHIRGENANITDEMGRPMLVHPHIRGENEFAGILATDAIRFTPTYVGKIVYADVDAGDMTGSPPHTWGKYHHT